MCSDHSDYISNKQGVFEMKNSYTLVSGTIFGIVAVVQAVRAINQWPIQVGPISVPVWFSWLAVVVAGGLCAWAFSLRRR
jgi:hypothetical protein